MDRKSPQFRLVQKYWYEQLAKEGFVDIENVDTDTLKSYTLCANNKTERFVYRETRKVFIRRYYELCSQLKYDPKFIAMTENYPVRRKIWDLHCEGEYPHIIASQVNMSRRNVRHILAMYIPLVIESNKHDESDRD